MHLRKKLKGLTLVSGGSTFNSYALGFRIWGQHVGGDVYMYDTSFDAFFY
jgi:hypothetical protein